MPISSESESFVGAVFTSRLTGQSPNAHKLLSVQALRALGLDAPLVTPNLNPGAVTLRSDSGQLEWLRTAPEIPAMPVIAQAIDYWNSAPPYQEGLRQLQNDVLHFVRNKQAEGAVSWEQVEPDVKAMLHRKLVSGGCSLLPTQALARVLDTTYEEAHALRLEAIEAILPAIQKVGSGATRREVLNGLAAVQQIQIRAGHLALPSPHGSMQEWRNLVSQPWPQIGVRHSMKPHEVTVCRDLLLQTGLWAFTGVEPEVNPSESAVMSSWGRYCLNVNQSRLPEVQETLANPLISSRDRKKLMQEFAERQELALLAPAILSGYREGASSESAYVVVASAAQSVAAPGVPVPAVVASSSSSQNRGLQQQFRSTSAPPWLRTPSNYPALRPRAKSLGL